uniref:Uncharacterized protein n=1 Tax=Anguilla anguilla TaxID=7936 RepID=A0A0E9R793_ANGAN
MHACLQSDAFMGNMIGHFKLGRKKENR